MAKTCLKCQGEISETGAFCPQCGAAAPTRVQGSLPTPGGPTFSGISPPSGIAIGAFSQFKFNAARWSTPDRITGIASGVLLISLFLPWFGVSLAGYDFTQSGLSAHGFLYLVLFTVIALLAYLGARAGWDRLPIRMNIAHNPLMLVVSLSNLFFVALAFILKDGGSGVGWTFGSFLAMAAALVAAGPLVIQIIRARST